MKKLFVITACLLLLLTGCGQSYKEKLVNEGYTLDELTIDIGLKKETKIIVVNDAHIQINDESVPDEDREYMTQRIGLFSVGGITTEARFKRLSEIIGKADVSLCVFAGDMLDFNSEANADCLKEGFSKLKSDYIYIRSDHDVEDYWQKSVGYTALMERQAAVCDMSPLVVKEFDEFVVAGINLSHTTMNKEIPEKMKEVFSLNKPVIVVTHVPFGQSNGTELKELSEATRDGKKLYWSTAGDEYIPMGPELELMNMMYAEDSPVVAIFAAHLHEKWDGMVTENIREHIFAPCYMGNIGIVTVK